jgi:2-succinyl-6-hydroxy-2,4-cyclohexadiene-1-carboxylate synthase
MTPDLAQPGWRYARIPANDVSLGVACSENVQQKKPALVLLHGFTGSALSWLPYFPADDASRAGVVAIDMLGHGLSDAPIDPERYRMEHCQQDILTVLDTLGIGPGEAILLGYSMGGRIALSTAFSGFFRALILESASPGLASAEERERRRGSDEALARRIEHEGVEAFINYWEQIPLFASQRTVPAEIRQIQRAQRLNNRAMGLANSLRGMGTGAQPDLHARLPDLQLPVLLLTGELDPKFSAIGREMVEEIPQARLEIVPNAGHTIHLEQPAYFGELVHTFCAAVL